MSWLRSLRFSYHIGRAAAHLIKARHHQDAAERLRPLPNDDEVIAAASGMDEFSAPEGAQRVPHEGKVR